MVWSDISEIPYKELFLFVCRPRKYDIRIIRRTSIIVSFRDWVHMGSWDHNSFLDSIKQSFIFRGYGNNSNIDRGGFPAIFKNRRELPCNILFGAKTRNSGKNPQVRNFQFLYIKESPFAEIGLPLRYIKLAIKYPRGQKRGCSSKEGKERCGKQYSYSYFVALGAGALVGISLVTISMYCISYSVDASYKESYNPFPLQVIAFLFFMVGGCVTMAAVVIFVAILLKLF